MATRVDGSLLHLNINWAPTEARIERDDEDETDFVILNRPNSPTSSNPRAASHSEQSKHEEIIVRVSTTNAAYAEKEDGVLTRWFSSVWFPPTYKIARQQVVTMQKTNIDRGILHPTVLENLPVLVIDTTKEVSIKFSATYLANSSAKPTQYPDKFVVIGPTLFKSNPHIQVTLEKSALTTADNPIYFHCYDHPPTLEERVVTAITQGTTALVRSTSAAAVVTETVAETVSSVFDSVRENCSIS